MKRNIYYDDQCAFCQRCIGWVRRRDPGIFGYYPLGEDNPSSFVLEIENQRFKKGKALFGLFWHLGKGYALLGLFHFLPSFMIDWVYAIFIWVRHRSQCRS